MTARLNGLLAQSYSRQVAGFELTAGDRIAGRSGLKRHLARVTSIRRQLAAVHGDDLPDDDCRTLTEIAYLSSATEQEESVNEAAATCGKIPMKCSWDRERVLAVGAHFVSLERGGE